MTETPREDAAGSPPPSPLPSPLRFFPVTLFATVMGLSGLALAWRAAEASWGVGPVVSGAVAVLAAAVFGVVALTYLVKALRHRDAVAEELAHPVKINFFPAFSISLILLSMLVHPYSEAVARPLWIAGAALHLVGTLAIMSAWIGHRPLPLGHITPAWFIPVVGNVLAPPLGVQLGFVEMSWLLFSVGVIFWLVLLTLVFYRVMFHDPLPNRLLPTLAILLAPPSVGFLAWLALSGGELNAFGRVLYYAAVFTFLLLLVQLPRFIPLPFFLSWWAYSFPLAAFTVATFEMARLLESGFAAWAGVGLVAFATVVIGWLAVRTAYGAVTGQIFVPE